MQASKCPTHKYLIPPLRSEGSRNKFLFLPITIAKTRNPWSLTKLKICYINVVF